LGQYPLSEIYMAAMKIHVALYFMIPFFWSRTMFFIKTPSTSIFIALFNVYFCLKRWLDIFVWTTMKGFYTQDSFEICCYYLIIRIKREIDIVLREVLRTRNSSSNVTNWQYFRRVIITFYHVKLSYQKHVKHVT
jgi:hypothetical protein